MVQVAQVNPKLAGHREAVELVKEMGVDIGLPCDYLVEVAERVTERPWDEIDAAGAEAVVDLLAEALHRTVSARA